MSGEGCAIKDEVCGMLDVSCGMWGIGVCRGGGRGERARVLGVWRSGGFEGFQEQKEEEWGFGLCEGLEQGKEVRFNPPLTDQI